ncbi:MAG: hypothetical protein ABI835_03325 [Chloroflexota bacterium]
MNNHTQKPRTSTESGQFPRPDLSKSEPQEAPEKKPPVLDDPSITGVLPIIRINPEGEDTAKQRDDSASGKKPSR